MSSGSTSDFRDFVETVRARVDVADVIGADTELRRSGAVLRGRLPSHGRPALVVWPESQSWRDFRDGRGGDVFAWVMARDGCRFGEALDLLARRAGVRRPGQTDEAWRRELERAAQRRGVERTLTFAAHYYHRALPAEVRAEWFRDRYGLTDETVDELFLGWADGGLGEALRAAGWGEAEILASGLCVRTPAGRIEDFFARRLVFPYWRRGSVAYFIARRTEQTGEEPWEKAKYRKLPVRSERHPYIAETLQNDVFYNEDAARPAGGELLITEGVTDCISAMQAGVRALSPVTVRFARRDVPHLLELTARADRVVLCNDAEASGAGEAGALETAARLHAAGRAVRIATLPRPAGVDKVDVAEYLRDNPPEAFRALLDAAPSYVEHLIATTAVPHADELDRVVAPLVAAVCDSPESAREVYLARLSERFGVGKRGLARKVKAELTRRARNGRAEAPGDVPTIPVNDRQLRAICDDVEAALVHANQRRIAEAAGECPELRDPPPLFRRGGRLVRLAFEGGTPTLVPLVEAGLYAHVAYVADWLVETEDGARPVHPDRDAARHLLVKPPAGVPELVAVATAPFFARDGEVVTAAGYHAGEATWLQPDPRLGVLDVPAKPSPEDVAEARDLLVRDLLADFPFVAEQDRAHALAAFLLPFIRAMVDGPTPLHVVEAPTAGSGKGLLCNLVSIVATGSPLDALTLPRADDELSKLVTAELARPRPILLFDNVRERRNLASGVLASVLTADSWSGRILGESRVVTLPNRKLWLLTGNNPRTSMELARRCVRVRIDPRCDRPWLGRTFRHERIPQWATEHRAALVRAVLVLGRAWIAAGRPRGQLELGSFESWSAVLGGILEVAGVPGFLAGLEDFYETSDAEGGAWRAFVAAWRAKFGSSAVGVGELVQLCLEGDLLDDVLGDGSPRSQHTRLGRALVGVRDRMFGDVKVVLYNDAGKHKGRRYALATGRDADHDAAQGAGDLGDYGGTYSPPGQVIDFEWDLN